MKPAIVKYIGESNSKFTNGRVYNAYFLEYWQGNRNSLHVENNEGEITDFNPFKDFEVISDDDNVLNTYEALVRCVTHQFDEYICGLTYGETYKAIGRDKDGMYLVMDDSWDCYFYAPECFEVIEDVHGILAYQSCYYSYHGGKFKNES